MPISENKDNRLTIQIEPSLELRARQCADAIGESSLSNYVRAAIREKVERCEQNKLSVFERYEATQVFANTPSNTNSLNEDDLRVLRIIAKLAKVYVQ